MLMVYQRKTYRELLGWKSSGRRKPLILRGARQVGKSRLIQLVYPTISVQSQLIGLHDLSDFYRGKIVQHAVFQQLQAQVNHILF